MNATDRRSVPRSSPHPCPHCSATCLTDHHLRDAGNLGPDAAFLAGYCPVLAARRTATPYLPAPVEAPAFLWTGEQRGRIARLTRTDLLEGTPR